MKTKTKETKREIKNVYQMVTDRIIAQLENGIIPWEKPWTGVRDGAFNRVSKKSYSLLNQFILKHNGEYATYKQWTELGGQVRKGEKSEIVVFWKVLDIEDETEDGDVETKHIPLLKYINVFHISQVDGVEPLKQEELNQNDPIEEGEKILNDYWKRENIKIESSISNRAYYSPAEDLIHLPVFEQFENANEYYSTAFHESVHSTMAKNRCNRESELDGKVAAFGSEDYSKEELVAELGAACLMNVAGIENPKTFKNSAAYIQNWLQVLRNDVKFIVSASSRAEKAVKYILGEG